MHCPQCRAESHISTTNERLRRQHGSETVEAAIRNAQSERDLIRSAAFEASQAQRGRAPCDICGGLVRPDVAVHLLCGCSWHPRCAVGLIEDRLPQALETGHDMINCISHGRRGSVSASSVLRGISRIDDRSEGESARCSLAERLATLQTQIRHHFLIVHPRIRPTLHPPRHQRRTLREGGHAISAPCAIREELGTSGSSLCRARVLCILRVRCHTLRTT